MALIIYGCGGHARSVASSYMRNNKQDIVFVDENAKDGEFILGYPVYKEYSIGKNDEYFIAVGSNEKRKEITEHIYTDKKPVTIIDKLANISINARIGAGTYVGCGAYLGPEAVIGEGSIINTGSIVEHEVIVGNWCHIAPNATVCGRSVIGSNVMIGTGAHVIDYINICDDVCVGAGAVIVKDVMEPGTYIGVPGRKK